MNKPFEYECPTCKKIYQITESKMACTVLHSRESCCHYGEREITDHTPTVTFEGGDNGMYQENGKWKLCFDGVGYDWDFVKKLVQERLGDDAS